MTIIINIKSPGIIYDSRDFVYIGRGSIYGNPFSHKKSAISDVIFVQNLSEAISRFREWLTTDLILPNWVKPLPFEIDKLSGKVLGCYCKPLDCHGDVYIELLAGIRGS